MRSDQRDEYLDHVKVRKEEEEKEKIKKAAALAKKEQEVPKEAAPAIVDAFDRTYELRTAHVPEPLPAPTQDSRPGTPVFDPATHGRNNIGYDAARFPSPPPGRMTPGLADVGGGLASMQPDPEPNGIAPPITPLPNLIRPQPRRGWEPQPGGQQQEYQPQGMQQSSSHAQLNRSGTPSPDLSGDQYGQRPQPVDYGRRNFFTPMQGAPRTPATPYSPVLPDLRPRSTSPEGRSADGRYSGGPMRGPTLGQERRPPRYSPYGTPPPRPQSAGAGGGYGS